MLPAAAAPRVAEHLDRAHVTGPYRTLTQDISFGFDQLVEIALRALSPAVNDTFTAMTCIDWIGDCLCRITTGWHPQRIHRDRDGYIRLVAYQADYDRLVVTHSGTDGTICVLRPPGADPQAILLAARLVLAQDCYEELAGHLGVPAHWPRE